MEEKQMAKLIKFIPFCCLLLIGFTLPAAADNGGVTSSFKVGETTQSFTVYDITGKYKGHRICYVCEYQDEPNIIGFFQKPDEKTAEFITKMNKLVEQDKSRHLKAVAVIVSGMDAKPWLEKLSQSKGIKFPLVVLKKGPKDLAVRLYRLNPEVDNVFLVNIKRKVMANFSGIDAKDFQQVADAANKMLTDNNL